MKCPICLYPELAMTSREGIEIDYCPECRGVWLDRGELDKIIERSGAMATRPDHDDSRREHRDSDYKRHKPKNVWKELFDF